MTSASNKHSKPSGQRAVLYLRVATAQEDGMHDAALESQRRALYEYAVTGGYDIVGEYRDEGSTGTAKNRPSFEMCMARLRAGEADVLMVSRLDRVGRNAADIAACVDEMDQLGASLVAIDG
jgi:DNA invertase Pin-like site-specific DNA recombinase